MEFENGMFIYNGHILNELAYKGGRDGDWDSPRNQAISDFEHKERERIEKCIPKNSITERKLEEMKRRVLKLEAQIAKMTLHINNLERCLNVKYEPEPEKPFTLPQGYAHDWSKHDNDDGSKYNFPR